MKNNKWNRAWVLVILALLLAACTGSKDEPTETQAVTTPVTTAAPTEQTEHLPETTGATEETTEATEETTEPTEETTAPTTSSDDDDEEEETTAPTEAPLEVPDPGTEKNPYVEVVSEYPGKVSTVSVPAKGTVSYFVWGSAGKVITIEQPDAKLVCGERTYIADENGVLMADLSAMTTEAVITISNESAEARHFSLAITEPVGSKENPVELTDIDSLEAALKAGDADGIWYEWTAPATGTVTFSVTENSAVEVRSKTASDKNQSIRNKKPVEAIKELATGLAARISSEEPQAVQVPKVDVIIHSGSETWKRSDSETGELQLEVNKRQRYLIQVVAIADEAGTYPAVTVKLSGTLDIRPGTEENPLYYALSDIPETFTTVDIPGESQIYYNVTGAGGTVLTIEDNACVIHENVTYGPTVNGSVWVELPEREKSEAITLAVGNQNKEAKALTLQFAYKGSQACPEVLTTIDTIQAYLEGGDADGYYWQWTAADPGTVKLTLDAIQPETAVWDVTLSIRGTDRVTKLIDGTASIDVKAGETLILHGVAEEAVKLTFSGSFKPAPGVTKEDPLTIDPAEGGTLVLDEGRSFYVSGNFHGQILTIHGAADAVITWNNQTIRPDENGIITHLFPASKEEQPEPIVLCLTTTVAKSYTLTFSNPLGTVRNPDTMVPGENSIQLEAGDADGYTYLWRGEIEGELTITMPENDSWQYTLGGVTHNSGEVPAVRSQTISVVPGENILFTVNTFDQENPSNTPAGTVTFTASFYDPTLGTEANPIWLDMTDTVTIPAGQTVYCTARADGMTLTLTGKDVTITHNGSTYSPVNGTVTLACKGGAVMQTPVFAITNTGESDQTYKIAFTYPVGHRENPRQMVLGQNRLVLMESDTDGCFFTWTAEKSGTLTISMNAAAEWQYTVENVTSGVSGALRTSADEPLVAKETITVAAGDVIRIMVNTYDRTNPFAPPAGSVLFLAAFAE